MNIIAITSTLIYLTIILIGKKLKKTNIN